MTPMPLADGGITAPAVEDYLYSLLPRRDEVLTEMEAEAAKRKIPIVGPAVAASSTNSPS